MLTVQKARLSEKPKETTEFPVDKFYRPLKGRKYFLHVNNPSIEDQLNKKIRKFGGATAVLLDQVYAVITDDPFFVKFSQQKRKNHINDGKFPGENSNNVVNCGASCSSNNTTTCTSLFFESTSLQKRKRKKTETGSTDFLTNTSLSPTSSLKSVDHYYRKMPGILRQACDLRLKIETLQHFQQILAEIETRMKNLHAKRKYKPPPTPNKLKTKVATLATSKSMSLVKPVKLQEPFFKFEDYERQFCPVYRQFGNVAGWPQLSIRPGAKGCPFERRVRSLDEENPSEQADSKNFQFKQANNRNDKIQNPRRNNPKPANKGAFCDLCQCWADNIAMHVTGDMHHKNAINLEKYRKFDTLVNQGSNLDLFLDDLDSGKYISDNEEEKIEKEVVKLMNELLDSLSMQNSMSLPQIEEKSLPDQMQELEEHLISPVFLRPPFQKTETTRATRSDFFVAPTFKRELKWTEKKIMVAEKA